MPKIISLHSFSRGTGKSNIIANIAAILAKAGMRVGVIDTDLLSPSVHILFNLATEGINKTWTNYLWGEASVEDIVYDVTPTGEQFKRGKIYLAPASIEISSILHTLREGFEIERINKGFVDIAKSFDLDILLIDTYAGMSEETITSLAISDMLYIVMRLDQQDYQGTGLIIDIGRQLGVTNISLILNDVLPSYDTAVIRKQIKENYNCEIASILPHSPQMLTFASRGIFVNHYPENPMTDAYRNIVAQIIG